MTTATASPTKFTLPMASAGWGGALCGSPFTSVIAQPQISGPTSAMSPPVNMPRTPGIAAAASVSTPFSVAWA